jgi:hypothetical protein
MSVHGDTLIRCRQNHKDVPRNYHMFRLFELYTRNDPRWLRLITSWHKQIEIVKIGEIFEVYWEYSDKVYTIRTLKSELTCSGHQLILTRDGFRYASELQVGDVVGLCTHKRAMWTAITEKVDRPGQRLYGLRSTSGAHIANSFVISEGLL